MRIPLPPVTFKKNEDEIFFCVRTDMEIENSMFHKKDDTFTIDYTKLDKHFEFYDNDNEANEYLVPVKKRSGVVSSKANSYIFFGLAK